jgi:anaerobic selenocysteine-containing dehydrogenase
VLPDGRWSLAPEPLVAQLAAIGEPAPLVLIPQRQWRHVNSYARDLPQAEREPAEVVIHPVDAADAGVTDGARVRVQSAWGGALEARARLDERIRPGAVAIPHGWDDPNVSLLLSGREAVDPLTGMPTYGGVPVTLQATDGPVPAGGADDTEPVTIGG